MLRQDEDGIHDGNGGGHVFRCKSYHVLAIISKPDL